jgi:tripartite-type tricarboxylate transporter receptor subunit TctC
MKPRTNIMMILLSFLVCWGFSLSPTFGAEAEPFYKGKRIRIVVGLSSGGGYDRAARLVSRYMGQYIPGNPTMLVQNMPGAGSVIASSYVYSIAKADGLTLLAPHNNIYLNQLTGGAEVKFDVRKFHWIGASEKDDMMLFMRTDASYKSIGDIVKAKEAPRCGSTGFGSTDYVMSRILEETVGAKINNIIGYPGSSEIALALERGEIICMGLTISTYFTREPFLSWQKKGFIRFLVQSGRKRDERVPGAPTIHELMDEYKTPAINRRVAEAMMASGEWARALLVRPGTPLERVKILRQAYQKALNDPELIAEAKKGRVEVRFSSGEEIEELVRKVMDQPPEVVVRIKRLFV